MEFPLSARHRLLYKRDEIPSHYRSYRVPGAQPLYVEGDFGDYLTQIITSSDCSIQLNLFRINEAAYLHPYTVLSVLPLHFMLKGNIRCGLEGFGEAWLLENCYNLFYVPGGIRHQAWFEPGFHRSFHIDFSPTYLQQLAAEQDELREVNEKLSGQSAKGVQQHAATITPIIADMINTLLYDRPAEPAQQEVFIEITAKALLLKYVQDMPVYPVHFPGSDATKITAVADHIAAHPDHTHSITELAEKYGLNETALQRQFKARTGKMIGKFVIQERMKLARKLLQPSHLSIHDIAIRYGYENFSSFDRAFYRQFGCTPRSFRK